MNNEGTQRESLIESLKQLDEQFNTAEQYTREQDYQKAIKAYREVVFDAESLTGEFSGTTDPGLCFYCGRAPIWELVEPPDGPGDCCISCWQILDGLVASSPQDIEDLHLLAIRTAVNLETGKRGLEWVSQPSEEHPHFASNEDPQVDLSKRDVAMQLVALSQQIGQQPTPHDAYESDILDPEDVFAAFATWQDALDAAGLGE